jgi:hypothetical protein
MDDIELEKTLKKRRFVEHRSDLSDLIISQVDQNKHKAKIQNKKITTISSMFLLPQTVLIAAFLLFAGAIVGMEIESFMAFSEVDLEGYLYFDEDQWL